MLKTLQLRLSEYDSIVRKGAFEDLGRRIELIRGELTEMNPAGPLHDDYIAYLTTWSAANINPTKTLITSQTGLDLPEVESRPEPDLFWVRKARYRTCHPQAKDVQLAIEVADSSFDNDFEIKRRLYADVSIEEFWIVNCQANCVHVFRHPSKGDYQTQFAASAPETISPLIAPEAILDLRDLFEGE